jgi:Fur family transcriptional regulator, iron response regulator
MKSFDTHTLLTAHGLRCTRPRVKVAELLFADGKDRHITAEWVAEKLGNMGEAVALATVYNTLNSFMEAGLLVQINGLEAGRHVFDTNTEPHHHFYNETTGNLTDMPPSALRFYKMPQAPAGTEIVDWQVVVRVR